MGKPVRIILTGDLHVGRRPSRVSDHIDCKRCSCAAAWQGVVDYALQQKADVVAISGDLVDRENRFYEAFGPLEKGLRRLSDAGIDTVAVAGNHDFDVLPRLADQLTNTRFKLLGRDGQWQRHTIERDGRPVLHVDGWSFSRESVLDSPLRGCPPWRADAVPAVGLVHGDLDQPASRYAPLALAELRATCHRLWLLGHVHKPAVYDGDGCATVLYPGSPQGMDPGETGAHGPWVLDLNGDVRLRPRHVPMCRVRYERIEIDVTGVADKDQLLSRVVKGVQAHLRPFCEGCETLELVSCRIVLTGRTTLHRHLRHVVREMQPQLELTVGAVDARIERIDQETRPEIDLAELARGSGPPAALARLLNNLAVGGVNAESRGVVDRLTRTLGDVWEARAYLPLNVQTDAEHPPEPPPDAGRARALLIDRGLLLLDELLGQKEGE